MRKIKSLFSAGFFIAGLGLICLLAGGFSPAAAAYKISAEVLDAGGSAGQSSSYRLLGKAREREVRTRTGGASILYEGFIQCAYFSRALFAPIVTGISPSSAPATGPVSAVISGANFLPGATVRLSMTGEADITGSSVSVPGTDQLTCQFDLTGAKGGAWTVTVINTDGRSGSLPDAFRVTYEAPVITSITPAKGLNDRIVDITNLAGRNFRPGAVVKLTLLGESDIFATVVTVTENGKITCHFDLTGKTAGLWDVVVINDDGQSATLPQGFAVETPNLDVTRPVEIRPNPYTPQAGTAVISYGLSKDADISVYIFNMRGERIWEYRAGAGTSGGRVGLNEVVWDGVNAFRAIASSGAYLIHVTATVNGEFKALSKTKLLITK